MRNAEPPTREALRARERANERLGGRVATLRSFAAEVRPRVTADRDVVELPRVEPGVLEAPARRERGKAGAVLDPVEPLLLGGGHEHAVDDERRRRIPVIRVQPEDRGHGRIVRAAAPPFGEKASPSPSTRRYSSR